MRIFDWASIDHLLRQPLARAIGLSLCLHLALLAWVQVRPIVGAGNEQVIEVRLLAPALPAEYGAGSEDAPPQTVREASVPVPVQADAAEGQRPVQRPEPVGPALELPALFDAHWYAAREVDSHPRAVGSIRPVYPESARRQGVSGWVKLRLKIDEQGRVAEVEAVEAQPRGVFDAAAAEAFKQARFEPARRQGLPVRYEGYFRVTFELE